MLVLLALAGGGGGAFVALRSKEPGKSYWDARGEWGDRSVWRESPEPRVSKALHDNLRSCGASDDRAESAVASYRQSGSPSGFVTFSVPSEGKGDGTVIRVEDTGTGVLEIRCEKLGSGPRPAGSATPAADPVRELNDLAATAGCSPLESPPIEGAEHVSPPARVSYSTTPPTSGSHYSSPDAPGPTGIHDGPIQNEVQVHNLEHGHIGIQYRNVNPAVSGLEDVARSDPQWIFLAPYFDMGHAVAFTAWGRLLTCDNPNARVGEVAQAFIAAFKAHAPETIPGTPAG